jgi:methionyl-tRNA formyltransferase
LRIVFFGTPHFARTILEYLLDQNVEVAAVVTRPDKPRSRSNRLTFMPVKELALAKHLPLYQPPKASDPDFAAFLKTLHADFFIVAAYAEILKENILEIPRLGCINVHGSILPKYRGAAPVQRSIMAGETETGVTIMKMALQMDAGDILAIRKTPIPLEVTAGELMEVLADLGKVALWEVMQGIEKGTLRPMKQDPAQASFAKKLTPADAEIDWSRPCEVVHNQIRGVNPNPGAWCWVEIKGERKRLLVKKTLPYASLMGLPGEIVSKAPSELVVGCLHGSVRLLEVQLEGKKALAADAFLRGIPLDRIKFFVKFPPA